jgi:hypothetical protein
MEDSTTNKTRRLKNNKPMTPTGIFGDTCNDDSKLRRAFEAG